MMRYSKNRFRELLPSQVKSMGILRYNEGSMMRDLDRMAVPFRVIFAAAVAERLLPAYVHFSHKTGSGSPNLLTEILERLWRDIQGIQMDPEELQQNIDLAMKLIPDGDDILIPGQEWTDDPAAAVAYALLCRQNGKSQDSAWAAGRAYTALDEFVSNHEDIDPGVAGAEEQILSHPLVQDELMRQQRDLRELAAANLQDQSAVAQKIRQRAKTEYIDVFNKES
jgi:uncharacterized protein YjaG (DUF416 family)